MSRYAVALITVLALGGFANQAQATVVFSGSSGGLSASASFTISGTQLVILLSNTDAATGADAPDVPSEVLSGLFFNLGTAAFTPVLAKTQGNGSIIQTANCDIQSCSGQTNIGGEWSYAYGGVNWLNGTNQGIASSGYLNANTSSGNFNGPNYESPPNGALNGIEFGLVPNNWVAGSGNGGLNGEALIEGTAKFVLTIPSGLTEADITNVYFTYGTSAGENTVPGTTSATPTSTGGTIPEPALLTMLGMGLVGAGYRMRKLKSRA